MTKGAVSRWMPAIVSWQPLGWVMIGSTVLVTLGDRGDAPSRLSIAGAAVAAATAFLLDDPAAATLAPSPTPLHVRRLHRMLIAAAIVPLWWAATVSLAADRVAGLFVRGLALELTVLTFVALAGSAAASARHPTDGGIVGAVCSIACFASTFLPPRWWLPFPGDPTGPGAPQRLTAILACAIALLVWSSRDPARRTGIPLPSR